MGTSLYLGLIWVQIRLRIEASSQKKNFVIIKNILDAAIVASLVVSALSGARG